MLKVNKGNWKSIDVNVSSLWLIGPRAGGGKHTNVYHGNFVPQIPNHLIRRYTDEGDVVLDIFTGSGTTLYECEELNRNFIGLDINPWAIDFVRQHMGESGKIQWFLHQCDATDRGVATHAIGSSLAKLQRESVDFLIAHPPYLDIIKFSEEAGDISRISDVDAFLGKFTEAMGNGYAALKDKGYFALVAGDIYRNSEVIPLAFLMMREVQTHFACKLKGIVIKDMVGNRAKIGQEALWKYHALKSDFFLFKHEYIFVFKKETPKQRRKRNAASVE